MGRVRATCHSGATLDKGVHARLRAHVLELGMYGVAYQVRENEGIMLSRLREAVEAAL